MSRKPWGSGRTIWSDVGKWGSDQSDIPSATLTGTCPNSPVESSIVTGGDTLIITLSNCTWVPTVGADNAITDALMAGITSAQVEATGWNAEVRDNMVFGDVTRTSDIIVTILLGAEASYAITANETITVTIPATATSHTAAIVATPTFQVINEA
jgi:hypothetical protein